MMDRMFGHASSVRCLCCSLLDGVDASDLAWMEPWAMALGIW